MIIKCAIPVFEGLLPKQHDQVIRRLLFEMATWHGLAKLRLHTETTVIDLENSTTRLGNILRVFQSDICPYYQTQDLPSEEAARGRRQAAAAAKKSTNQLSTLPSNKLRPEADNPKESAKTKGKKPVKPPGKASMTKKGNKFRKFSLTTYKAHSFGGYAKAIRLFGTTDNYSTQNVSLSELKASL